MYTQTDYEQFANDFAARLGVNHSLQFDSPAGPCVDASNCIHLPPFAPGVTQDADAWAKTRAAIVHEMAHIHYCSNTAHADLQRARGELFGQCFNACLDVADETGIERDSRVPNPLTKNLLLNANARIHSNPALRNHAYALHWRILAAGIIKARLVGAKLRNVRSVGRQVTAENPHIDIPQIFRLLKACRLSKRVPNKHATIVKHAARIVDLLAPIFDASAPIPAEFSGDKLTPLVSDSSAPAIPAIPAVGYGSAEIAANSQSVVPTRISYPPCQTTRAMFLPIVRQITQRIAVDGDSLSREDSLSSGASVVQPYRLQTDGLAFGRHTTDPHADGMAVAVLLDISNSMMRLIRRTAAIADAFSTALQECSEVTNFLFGSSVQEVPNFRAIADLDGGTNTDTAIRAARTVLSRSSAGRKYIVVITDGEPWDRADTATQTRAARADGIRVLGVILQETYSKTSEQSIRESMPGASLSIANDAAHLAIELRAISTRL